MTDRELMELAAKAAGYQVKAFDSRGCLQCFDPESTCIFGWNPLTVDGDALGLAVKLRLLILPNTSGTAITVDSYTEIQEATEQCGDPYDATRRAIVRAAAALGKASSNSALTGAAHKD